MENDYDYVVSERVAEKLLEQYSTVNEYNKMSCDFYHEYTQWFKDYVIADNCVADLLIDQHVDKLMDDLGEYYLKHTSLHVTE